MKLSDKLLTAGLTAAAMMAVIPESPLSAAAQCASLALLKLPDTRITLAEPVPTGSFSRPSVGRGSAGQAFSNAVAFCRVAATVTPSSDSEIKIEVWLPPTGWNGKFQAVGNGSWGGTINYAAMSEALKNGYATSSTDTGHIGASAAFALGHPEKLIDYAYRSEHEMAVKAKAIIGAYYGTAPKLSYFEGCSTGGRQALMAAQRFPADFDGIIAGAAANPKTHVDAWRISMAQTMFTENANAIPSSKFPMIHAAVLNTCDALDGLQDRLIDDPTRCRFDPKTIECKGSDASSCLTPAQVSVARVLMSPLRDRRTGAEIFPGFAMGTELGWAEALDAPGPWLENAWDQYKYITFRNAKWDWREFDLERDLASAINAADGTLSAINPDLSAFAQRGGKLLMYHGWSDPAIPPGASVSFYSSTLAATDAVTVDASWLRLFMVPGMGHCRGGEAPNTFDMMSALDAWVEKGTPPARILALQITSGKTERTRPLCPYPEVARYRGTGSIDDAANFVCRVP